MQNRSGGGEADSTVIPDANRCIEDVRKFLVAKLEKSHGILFSDSAGLARYGSQPLNSVIAQMDFRLQRLARSGLRFCGAYLHAWRARVR